MCEIVMAMDSILILGSFKTQQSPICEENLRKNQCGNVCGDSLTEWHGLWLHLDHLADLGLVSLRRPFSTSRLCLYKSQLICLKTLAFFKKKMRVTFN